MASLPVALTGIVGNTIVVKSFQEDAYGVSSSTAVTWSTSAASVAIVSQMYNSNNAVISCFTAGTATITATMGAVTATFALTVNASAAPAAGAKLIVESDQSYQPVNKTAQTQTS